MKNTIINHKKYSVERVFNMVLNYEFTDKNGRVYLVDGEDVSEWMDDHGVEPMNGIDAAIQYAKFMADISEDGTFWWKVKA